MKRDSKIAIQAKRSNNNRFISEAGRETREHMAQLVNRHADDEGCQKRDSDDNDSRDRRKTGRQPSKDAQKPPHRFH